MRIKGLTDEDFVNYKLPSLFICTATCTFKCDRECGRQVCQNSALASLPTLEFDTDAIIGRYLSNPITKAVVFGGLEPFDQYDELFAFLLTLRVERGRGDPVVIYTGYNEDEISGEVQMLSMFPNVIIKFGRYIPDQAPHFDPVLGVELASENQHAVNIST